MQSLLAGRLPFRIVVMIVVDMISIGLTPSNRIMSILPSSAGADGGLSWKCLSSNPFINPFIKMLKIPLLVSLGHHGGRRKVASLRPPFSTPATPRDKPEPAGPFPPSIERAPPLFVRIPAG